MNWSQVVCSCQPAISKWNIKNTLCIKGHKYFIIILLVQNLAQKYLQIVSSSSELHIYWKWGICDARTDVVSSNRIQFIHPICVIVVTFVMSFIGNISHRKWLHEQLPQFIINYKGCWKGCAFDRVFIDIPSTPTPIVWYIFYEIRSLNIYNQFQHKCEKSV